MSDPALTTPAVYNYRPPGYDLTWPDGRSENVVGLLATHGLVCRPAIVHGQRLSVTVSAARLPRMMRIDWAHDSTAEGIQRAVEGLQADLEALAYEDGSPVFASVLCVAGQHGTDDSRSHGALPANVYCPHVAIHAVIYCRETLDVSIGTPWSYDYWAAQHPLVEQYGTWAPLTMAVRQPVDGELITIDYDQVVAQNRITSWNGAPVLPYGGQFSWGRMQRVVSPHFTTLAGLVAYVGAQYHLEFPGTGTEAAMREGVSLSGTVDAMTHASSWEYLSALVSGRAWREDDGAAPPAPKPVNPDYPSDKPPSNGGTMWLSLFIALITYLLSPKGTDAEKRKALLAAAAAGGLSYIATEYTDWGKDISDKFDDTLGLGGSGTDPDDDSDGVKIPTPSGGGSGLGNVGGWLPAIVGGGGAAIAAGALPSWLLPAGLLLAGYLIIR